MPAPDLAAYLKRARPSVTGLLAVPRSVAGGVGQAAGSVVGAIAWEIADWTTEPSRRQLRSLASPGTWRQPIPAVAGGTVATVVVVGFELRRRGRRKAHTRLILRSVSSAVRR